MCDYVAKTILVTVIVLILSILLFIMTVTGCADKSMTFYQVPNPCHTTQLTSGAAVTCGGSTSVISNGTSCTVAAVEGGANITCGDSTEFVSDGQQGATGSQGNTGPQGPTGNPGTVITVTQLCGSCVPTYPNIFPEIGICIAGSLYGVYSANGGFMTLLTPGEYSSDGEDCSCTLTVAADCQVTQD